MRRVDFIVRFGRKMTATIKDLIEFLKDLPMDTELRVVEVYDCGYSQCAKFVPLDLDKYTGNIEYSDMSKNQFVKDDSELWDRRFLDFGET